MSRVRFPVYNPTVGEDEIRAVTEALRAGEISGTFGKNLPAFENAFAKYCGVEHGVAVTNGTVALYLAVRALGIGPGDEVLVSASTNIASALAIYHNGAIPVSVDSEEEHWNLDLDLIESLITPKTKAILVVHLFGSPVDMQKLMALADKHRLMVIEDCAEAHGARSRGKVVGSFGKVSCFSFYANKIITTGEGGMMLTDDHSLADQLRLLRNLAFQKPRFYHEVAGFNFRMTGYQAAMGLAQLKKLDTIIKSKRSVAGLYQKHLGHFTEVQLPKDPEWGDHVYWMYGVLLSKGSDKDHRNRVMGVLERNGIETRTFFCPMNIQPCLTDVPGYRRVSCPVAERLWTHGLYLPSSCDLKEDEIREISQIFQRAVEETRQ